MNINIDGCMNLQEYDRLTFSLGSCGMERRVKVKNDECILK